MDSVQKFVSNTAAAAADLGAQLTTNPNAPRSFTDLVKRTFSGWITLFSKGADFARSLPVTRTQVGIAGGVTLVAIALLFLRRSQRPARGLSPPRVPVAELVQKSLPEAVEMKVNVNVFDKRCSDHAIVSFYTADGPIISSNVMCSGEDFLEANPDPENVANSFGIDPRTEEGRQARFESMVTELAREAAAAFKQTGVVPILALQEFPRSPKVGRDALCNLIAQRFPNHQCVWGLTEKSEHAGSQLLMLVPRDSVVCEYAGRHPRIQVLSVNKIAFINIHPSPRDKHKPTDSIQDTLVQICKNLIHANEMERVHIVGDWNREEEELRSYWPNVHTPEGQTRYPQLSRLHQSMPTIDHHVVVAAQ